MRKQTGSRNRGWLPMIRRRLESYGGHVGNRLSVAAGVALVAGMLAALAPRAEAAVPSQMKITFGGYTNRSEVLNNFPVLVVFSNNVNNSGFHYGYFATTNGYDLRFGTNSTPTTNSLNYEIESWNPNGASYVWVQVPTIPTNGSGAIWANWGNTSASNQLACTTNGATWDSQFKAVWHLPNGTVLSGTDSTTNANTAGNSNGVTAVAGQVDGAANFVQGSSQYMDAGNKAAIEIAGPISIEAWVKYTGTFAVGKFPRIISNLSGSPFNGYELLLEQSTGNRFELQAGNNGTLRQVFADSASTSGTTYHVVGTYDGTLGRIYVNGVMQAGSFSNALAIASSSQNVRLGSIPGIAGSYYWNGFIDEARISSVARSSNWVWACYLTMASNTVFNNYGAMAKQPTPKGTVIMFR